MDHELVGTRWRDRDTRGDFVREVRVLNVSYGKKGELRAECRVYWNGAAQPHTAFIRVDRLKPIGRRAGYERVDRSSSPPPPPAPDEAGT